MSVAYEITTPCREWQGSRKHNGYGRRYLKIVGGGYYEELIHIFISEQIDGPIPEGIVVMHLCDNPACFRYDHLRRGTQAENLADMRAKGRHKHRSYPRIR